MTKINSNDNIIIIGNSSNEYQLAEDIGWQHQQEQNSPAAKLLQNEAQRSALQTPQSTANTPQVAYNLLGVYLHTAYIPGLRRL